MNKAELIAAVARKTGLSKKDSEKAVCAVFDSITENLKNGGKVQIVGFGAFEVRQRAAHIGRNPRTKEEVRIPATSVPAFRAGKALKDEISK
jgi:DNA-binding protein HU-beta